MTGTRTRADLGFGDALEGFNPADWAPAATARPKPPAELARQAAQATGFQSREAGQGRAPAAVPAPAPAAVPPRRRRTGRNTQFNLKARPETIAAFAAIADAQGWGFGETLEVAVALLERDYGTT